jgi:predicted acylesterase/phospholipase RssA
MKRALVVSGGGSKGAFAVGVIKQLVNDFPHLGFDAFVGTSTGSLLTPLAAIQEYALLEQLYTTQTTANVITKANIGDRLNEHSIFDATPLWNLISNFYTDARYNQLINSGKKFYLNAVCLQTAGLVVFTNDASATDGKYYTVKKIINADHFRRAVMASACQPVFMPPVKVNQHVPGEANPDYQFVDGGVREYVGIQMAIDAGADEIFTIILSPDKDDAIQTEFKTLLPILERTIDIFSTDVGKNDTLVPLQYNNALVYIDAVKKKMVADGLDETKVDGYFNTGNDNPFAGKRPIKIYFIKPSDPLGGGPGGLTFDPAEMKNMLATGRQIFSQFVAGLSPNDKSGWT